MVFKCPESGNRGTETDGEVSYKLKVYKLYVNQLISQR